MPPRASNQVSLWCKGTLLLTFWEMFPKGLSEIESLLMAGESMAIADQAILKMMEKGDE